METKDYLLKVSNSNYEEIFIKYVNNPPRGSSAPLQDPPICQTFNQNMQFLNLFEWRIIFCLVSSEFQVTSFNKAWQPL